MDQNSTDNWCTLALKALRNIHSRPVVRQRHGDVNHAGARRCQDPALWFGRHVWHWEPLLRHQNRQRSLLREDNAKSMASQSPMCASVMAVKKLRRKRSVPFSLITLFKTIIFSIMFPFGPLQRTTIWWPVSSAWFRISMKQKLW